MIFLIAPLEALTDARLSDPERRVLLALYSFRNKNADTVWPSIDSIAARANVKDRTWISRLTKGLAEKGWLTKKKRGFTGGNEYVLMVPEAASKELSNLDREATLGAQSKMDQEALSNLDCQATSNLDCQATYKEQQSEHTNEQQLELLAKEQPEKIQYQGIANLYNQILGESLGSIRAISPDRRKHIKARINEEPEKRLSLDWWGTYFELVSITGFLLGEGPPKPDTGKPWKADFDWLINPNNMIKVLERRYEREQ